MKNEHRKQPVTRSDILKRLSVEEAASVSDAETAGRLGDGDEYLDLRHPERGVRWAQGPMMPNGRVLPRKAVRSETWEKLVEQVVAVQRATLN